MGNRSLDDFLGGDSEATADESQGTVDESGESADESEAAADESEAAADEPNATDSETSDTTEETSGGDEAVDSSSAESSEGDEPPVAAATVEPAVSTYTWSGDGGVCETCGETVDRRWRQDDALVCPDCKEW